MKIGKRLLAKIRAVRGKRPRTVLNHMLEHGQITTQELRDLYGYNHPPRRVRDVREHGIPVETFRVRGPDGRKIAAYRLNPRQGSGASAKRGRAAFSPALKRALVKRDGPRCQVCNAQLNPRYLQVDHRVPYEIAGERQDLESHPEELTLLCGPCNRAKSWSCEHCENLLTHKRVRTCKTCYWARPNSYTHVATVQQRRAVLLWTGTDEVQTYERLSRWAAHAGKRVEDLILERVKQLKSSCSARGQR